MIENPIESGATQQCHAHNHELVDRVGDFGDVDSAERIGRLPCDIAVSPPDQFGDVFKDQEDCVGDQHHEHFVSSVHKAQDAALYDKSGDDTGQNSHDRNNQIGQSYWVVGLRVEPNGPGGAVGAERVESAVCDVEYSHHAVDQSQAH
jgi:hypothetical protein